MAGAGSDVDGNDDDDGGEELGLTGSVRTDDGSDRDNAISPTPPAMTTTKAATATIQPPPRLGGAVGTTPSARSGSTSGP